MKANPPKKFEPGDVVRNIWTGEIFTAKKAYWQLYDGLTSDYTMEFEPTETQPTPWTKSSNLELVRKAGDA